MACTKLLSRSNCLFNHKLNQNLLKRNNKHVFCFNKSLLSLNSAMGSQSYYSTVFCLTQSSHPHKKHAFPTMMNPVLFMSTHGGGEEMYRVVVTNPGQPTSSTDLFLENTKSSSAITNFDNTSIADSATSSGLSDAALSFSSDLQTISHVAEPTLASIGLAHWTPVGLIQMLLESLHVSFDMPWWGAIVATTLCVRLLMFPIMIKTQKLAINTGNYMPQLQYLQAKFGEARRTGNSVEASRYAAEIMAYMKEHNISPLKNAVWPLLQAPVFISFFMALRAMANAPVASMMYGGIGWATDLTVPDPYYILPCVASTTLYIVLKIGAESGMKLENMKFTKYIFMALPVVALPFTINFPAAILYYWVSTNFCTLLFVSILKIKSVRQFFELPTQKPSNPDFTLPKKGFIGGIKEAYEDQKVLAAVEDRRRVDNIRFQKAGTGPIPRTYSYDPTKPRPSNIAAAASKSRSNISNE